MSKERFEQWASTLLALFIQGCATSVLAVIGPAIGSSVGADIQPLSLKQVLWVCIAGGLAPALRYLKKAPMPDYVSTDTETITRADDNKENEK